MKRKLSRAGATALVFFTLVVPAEALIDATVFSGYTNIAVKDNGSPGATIADNTFRGMYFGASAHYHHTFFEWFSLGAGPYLAFAPSMGYSGEITSTQSTYSNSYFAIGIELQGKIMGLPFINPYLKAGFGSEALKSLATFPGVTIETRLLGSGYRLLGGIEITIIPLIFVYIEGGINGGWYDVAIGGSAGYKAKSLGYLAHFGVGVKF